MEYLFVDIQKCAPGKSASVRSIKTIPPGEEHIKHLPEKMVPLRRTDKL